MVHAQRTGVESEQQVLACLPVRLQRALLHESRAPHLLPHCLFMSWNHCHMRSFERLCCDEIDVCNYAGDTSVFCPHEECRRLIVVQSGCLAYTKVKKLNAELALWMMAYNTESNHGVKSEHYVSVQYGTILCETSLWTRWFHCGELETQTYTISLELLVSNFLKLLVRYPALVCWGRAHAQKIVVLLNDYLSEVSDLLDTPFFWMSNSELNQKK